MKIFFLKIKITIFFKVKIDVLFYFVSVRMCALLWAMVHV